MDDETGVVHLVNHLPYHFLSDFVQAGAIIHSVSRFLPPKVVGDLNQRRVLVTTICEEARHHLFLYRFLHVHVHGRGGLLLFLRLHQYSLPHRYHRPLALRLLYLPFHPLHQEQILHHDLPTPCYPYDHLYCHRDGYDDNRHLLHEDPDNSRYHQWELKSHPLLESMASFLQYLGGSGVQFHLPQILHQEHNHYCRKSQNHYDDDATNIVN